MITIFTLIGPLITPISHTDLEYHPWSAESGLLRAPVRLAS